jgi:hypothetical protein
MCETQLHFLYHVLGDAGGLCKTASDLLVPVTASPYILKIYHLLYPKWQDDIAISLH